VELAPGTILLGKYRIDELIGTGGMGNVVRASHLYLHQPVAIKILLPEMAENDSIRQRFLREAQATVKLKSEHSARVLDVGTMPDGVPFMVMEFLDGNDLGQILRHHGPQPPAIVVDLMLMACEGLAEAHALGIVHRDIKPSNFFLTGRPDGSMLLKILDFGISKAPVGYDELTRTQAVIGTPTYMAPEQMKDGRAADARSDIWSIGVVTYQLLTGRPPFSGESFAELVLKVGLEPPAPIRLPLPTGLEEVVLRCLEKDPGLRYQNVGEFARMLAPYATDPLSAAQSSARTARILQQRGAHQGLQGMPLAVGGRLSSPIPLPPAPITSHSWPPSQATSLSQGAGQVTARTRGGRGLMIAGLASLCAVAGVGGYAVSQLSRSGKPSHEPHVQAPLPPSSLPPTTPPRAPPAATPPAAPGPEPPAPASNVPIPREATSAVPTIMEPPAREPTPAETKAPAETKPTSNTKPTSDTKPAITKPAKSAKPTKSAKPKPVKRKKSGDIFDTRD
jgi:serine/threonine-protein kinase